MLQRRIPQVRAPTLLRVILYRGAKIRLLDNNRYGFKFEWEIPVDTPQLKVLVNRGRKRKYQTKWVTDPTSHQSLKMALYNAKVEVNGIRRPLSWP